MHYQNSAISISSNSIWVCPICKTDLNEPTSTISPSCKICQKSFISDRAWINLCSSEDQTNFATESAYNIYSKFYAPIALLAYLIVWKGNFFRHVRFFRELLIRDKIIIDIATGDGSLTSLALFTSKRLRANKVIAIDISSSMLIKAQKNLPQQNTTLIRADVCQLPFKTCSLNTVSCFGGFNSFPSGEKAMHEIARCLSPSGIVRGSVLLMPQAPWRKRLVHRWIKQGYQTEVVTLEKFESWVLKSGLALSHQEQHGDVLLFEVRHAN